ncbi:hypothetical protein QQ045_020084 [Rhodiola kirilowii]
MKNRFSQSITELLTCIACLDPKNSFCNFNKTKIIRLAELYPQEFSVCALMELEEELEGWIYEMRENENIWTGLRSSGMSLNMNLIQPVIFHSLAGKKDRLVHLKVATQHGAHHGEVFNLL